MTDDRLSDQQVSQLVGLGPCYLHFHPDYQPFDAQLSSLIPQVSQGADYTVQLTDSAKHILHPATDASARTFTIPANSVAPFQIGTTITFVNQHDAGVLTLDCGDTMYLAGTGSAATITVAANGIATALKITQTEWMVSGVGVS